MANSQCGNAQNGFMLNQSNEAAASSLGDATTTDARATTDAFDDADAQATIDAFDDATDARATTDALTDAGGGG